MCDSFDSDITVCSKLADNETVQDFKGFSSHSNVELTGKRLLSFVKEKIVQHLNKKEFLEEDAITAFLKQLRDYKPIKTYYKRIRKETISQLNAILVDITKCEGLVLQTGDVSKESCILTLTLAEVANELNIEDHIATIKEKIQLHLNKSEFLDNVSIKNFLRQLNDLQPNKECDKETINLIIKELNSIENNETHESSLLNKESLMDINLTQDIEVVEHLNQISVQDPYKNDALKVNFYDSGQDSNDLSKIVLTNNLFCTPGKKSNDSGIDNINSSQLSGNQAYNTRAKKQKMAYDQVSSDGLHHLTFTPNSRKKSVVLNKFNVIRHQMKRKANNENMDESQTDKPIVIKPANGNKPDDSPVRQIDKSPSKTVLNEICINKGCSENLLQNKSYNNDRILENVIEDNAIYDLLSGLNLEDAFSDEDANIQKELYDVRKLIDNGRFNVVEKLKEKEVSNLKLRKIPKNKVSPFDCDGVTNILESESDDELIVDFKEKNIKGNSSFTPNNTFTDCYDLEEESDMNVTNWNEPLTLPHWKGHLSKFEKI